MTPENDHKFIIIQGLTRDGRKFRPSDWAERLCGLLSTMDRRHRVVYSPLLTPFSRDGVKAVAVDTLLESQMKEVFQQVMRFADSNQLQMIYPEPDTSGQAFVA